MLDKMKTIILTLGLFAAICASAKGDINSDIESLTKACWKVKDAIKNAPEEERPKLYDCLREHVGAMAFGFAYAPEGSDSIKTAKSDAILVDLVYSAFTADQAHLERAIIHTNDREKAISVMPDRAGCLLGLFPICRSIPGSEVAVDTPAFGERVLVVQYLARAYLHISDSLVESVRPQMSRWRGEERIPGLLVLAESGDEDARAELEGFTSKLAGGLKKLFRGVIDHEKKRGEEKGSTEKAGEPKSGR
jgi:hypothetical protein